MAADKVVDSTQLDADLTSVANAIRTKGGTSASLAFPAGFVSAIGNIPSGGGSVSITGISAVYTQNGAVDVTDSLTVLEKDLVVTATINSSFQIDVSPDEYSLSGTLAVGTSTITVSCHGFTDTFSVTVTQEWDYTWTYADGKLSDNGWTVNITDPNGSEVLTSSGLELNVTASDKYINCTPTADVVSNAAVMTTGVMEVIYNYSAIANKNGARIRLSNGTNGISTITNSGNQNRIRLLNAESGANGREIAVARTGVDFNERLTLYSNSASVWFNDFLVLNNINIRQMLYTASTSIFWQNTVGKMVLKRIRFKVNRTS